ncbi:MAG: AraC family transcriptional regulator [Lachnospiraceae bacterium]|nr:AraC family transcriptional regulator [Lachnospiraceae bacterium]
MEHRLLRKHFLILTLSLWIFSVLLAILSQTVQTIWTDESENDAGALILESYLSSAFDNLNTQYLDEIDAPMEEIFQSSYFIGLSFSSTQYPPEDTLLDGIRTTLANFTESSDLISASFIYASSTETTVSDSDAFGSDLLNDIIYSYNSNSTESKQVSVDGHNTFLFTWQNYLIVAKNLVTLSGQTHASLFAILNLDQMIAEINTVCDSLGTYTVNVYDAGKNLLYNNDPSSEELPASQWFATSEGGLQIDSSGDSYHVSYTSELLHWQYVFDIALNSSGTGDHAIMVLLLFCLLLLIPAAGISFLLCRVFQTPFGKLASLLDLTGEEAYRHPLTEINKKVAEVTEENQSLKNIVHTTQAEALSAVFSLIITEQLAEKETIEAVLNSSDRGFQFNDIYIAGVVSYYGGSFLEMEDRYRILKLINTSLDKYTGENGMSTMSYVSGNTTFALIISFPPTTSIAKGKSCINKISRLLEETFVFSKQPLAVAFGHLYNSILDLSYSYKEAFSILQRKEEVAVTAIAGSVSVSSDYRNSGNAGIIDGDPVFSAKGMRTFTETADDLRRKPAAADSGNYAETEAFGTVKGSADSAAFMGNADSLASAGNTVPVATMRNTDSMNAMENADSVNATRNAPPVNSTGNAGSVSSMRSAGSVNFTESADSRNGMGSADSVNSMESTDSATSAALEQQESLSDIIERRAIQIVTTISNDQDADIAPLIDRSIQDIYGNIPVNEQFETGKRLISAVTDHMISQKFMEGSQLADVYSTFSSETNAQLTSEERTTLLRQCLLTLCESFSDIKKRQHNPYVLSALQYISENYKSQELSLEDIAENLKIAPNYLSSIFSKSLGKRLFEYVNEYRLEKSLDLLLYTSKTINDISEATGFGSARNYIRIFKKYKGTTPGAYRKQFSQQGSLTKNKKEQ